MGINRPASPRAGCQDALELLHGDVLPWPDQAGSRRHTSFSSSTSGKTSEPTTTDPDLTRALVMMLVKDFGALNLLAGGLDFVNRCVQALKRKRYRSRKTDGDR